MLKHVWWCAILWLECGYIMTASHCSQGGDSLWHIDPPCPIMRILDVVVPCQHDTWAFCQVAQTLCNGILVTVNCIQSEQSYLCSGIIVTVNCRGMIGDLVWRFVCKQCTCCNVSFFEHRCRVLCFQLRWYLLIISVPLWRRCWEGCWWSQQSLVQWPPNPCRTLSCHRLQGSMLSPVWDGVSRTGTAQRGSNASNVLPIGCIIMGINSSILHSSHVGDIICNQ